MGFLAGVERCGVIAADLDGACSLGSHAVIITRDADFCGLETTLEVRTYRSGEHDYHVILGGAYADLGGCADLERTDVERGSRAVRRDEALVELDHHADHFLEFLYGQLLHADALRAAAEALGVLVHAEHAHLAVFSAECLESLERLLAVVQTGCRYVKGNVFILCGDDFAPFAVLELTADVPVGLYISEGEFAPFDFGLFHDFDKVLWFKIASVYSVGQRNVECHTATLHVTSPIFTM